MNDLFLETLALINFCWRRLIPNNKESSLFLKICCFWENCCIGNLFQWSSLWICKNIWMFAKKWSLEFTIADNAFNNCNINYLSFSTIQAQQSESVHQYSILYHSTALVLLTCLQPGHEHYVHDLLSTVLFHTAFLA